MKRRDGMGRLALGYLPVFLRILTYAFRRLIGVQIGQLDLVACRNHEQFSCAGINQAALLVEIGP